MANQKLSDEQKAVSSLPLPDLSYTVPVRNECVIRLTAAGHSRMLTLITAAGLDPEYWPNPPEIYAKDVDLHMEWVDAFVAEPMGPSDNAFQHQVRWAAHEVDHVRLQ